MPIRNYGLLTGLVAGFRPQASNPHHLLDVAADSQNYRVAINLGAPTHSASTQSQTATKSDLQYQIVPDLLRTGAAAKSLISKIKNISTFRVKETTPNLPTVDYVHGQIVNMKAFQPLPSASGAFARKITSLVDAVSAKGDAFVAVFGTGYPDQDDRITGLGEQINPLRDSFGFTGIDNVHMNQGSFYRIGGHSTPTSAKTGPIRTGPSCSFCPMDRLPACS